MFGLNGENFIKTMINEGKTHDEVRLVNMCETEKYGLSKAARLFNSRLDKKKLTKAGFMMRPAWQDAVSRYLNEAWL